MLTNDEVFKRFIPFFLFNGRQWCPEEWEEWQAARAASPGQHVNLDSLQLIEDQEILNLSRAKNGLSFEQLKLNDSLKCDALKKAAVYAFALKFSLAVFEDRIGSD